MLFNDEGETLSMINGRVIPKLRYFGGYDSGSLFC